MSAIISPCQKYRYWLDRTWFGGDGLQVFIMLNPSTADANEDDPTIRRCMGFAKREGAHGIVVVNLFALRATNPRALVGEADLAGPDNYNYIMKALLMTTRGGRPAICAWGAHKLAVPKAIKIRRLADMAGANLVTLGLTKSGAPKHPLYLPKDAPLTPY